ncbi:MAG: Hsp20/alpha crystallin family protein [Myxococcota bacterium]
MISVRNRDRFNELFWGPWAELERFQRDLDHLFAKAPSYRARARASNVFANDDLALVQLALPGFSKDELDLSVEGKTLIVRGHRPEDGEVNYRRREFGGGRFEQVFELPFAVATEGLTAKFEDGVLEVQLPRAEADKPRRIEINA